MVHAKTCEKQTVLKFSLTSKVLDLPLMFTIDNRRYKVNFILKTPNFKFFLGILKLFFTYNIQLCIAVK